MNRYFSIKVAGESRRGDFGLISGSMTVETALVLPLVIILLAVLLYMSNILYVENTVHGKMLIASDKLALSACVLDKSSLLGDMQKKYQEGDEIVGQASEMYQGFNNTNAITGEGFAEITNLLNDSYKEITNIRGSSPKEFLNKVSNLNSNFNRLRESLKNSAFKFLPDFDFVLNVGENLTNAGKAFGINALSQLISREGMKYEFYKLISEEDLKKMRLSDLEIKNGAFLIPDDSISFTYSYTIFFPFISEYFSGGYEVERTVCTRAFTGSYDAMEVKKKKEKNSKKFVYIATTSAGNSCYHYISCLRKPADSIGKDEIKGREICERCKKNKLVGNKFYCVSGSSKIHYDRKCSSIYSRYVKRLTIEEAKKMGYRPCSKKGCVGDSNNK